MSEYCNYCKTEITISNSYEVIWKLNLISSKKKEELKKENSLICSTCLEVYYIDSKKLNSNRVM